MPDGSSEPGPGPRSVRLDAPPARYSSNPTTNNNNNKINTESTNNANRSSSGTEPRIQQPKPQALPQRGSGSAILVSPRQKGNPILNSVKALPWEYADIPADYVLGATTCALFLSLKYHKLHPEYIYSRIRGLAGKYSLRVVLTMVDIPGHEDAIRELTKTSLVNDVTVILCWSAPEAARYLELYKSYEGAAPTSIRAHQATTYSDKLVEFITAPRSINKTDAVSLVSAFGSIRTAVNAPPESVALVDGWGEKKVQRWCATVRDGFKAKRATKRKLHNRDGERSERSKETASAAAAAGAGAALDAALHSWRAAEPHETASAPSSLSAGAGAGDIGGVSGGRGVPNDEGDDNDGDELLAMREAETAGAAPPRARPAQPAAKQNRGQGQGQGQNAAARQSEEGPDPHLSEGMAAALKRLRGE